MKRTFIGVTAFFIVSLTFLGVYGYFSFLQTDNKVAPINTQTTSGSTQKQYEHIFPEQLSKNDFFIGEFIRNDAVSIYPRRQAIVQDILVDIGDEVKKGQTLALLFEPGVQGQSASNIAIKSTQKKIQEDTLRDTKTLFEQKLAEFDTRIQKKQVLLNNTTLQEQEKLKLTHTRYAEKLETLQLQLQEEQQKLTSYEVDLQQRLVLEEEKIKEVISQSEQLQLQLQAKLSEIRTHIFDVIYIGKAVDYSSPIYSQDISIFLSAKNTALRDELISHFQNYTEVQGVSNIETQVRDMKKILQITIGVLESTITSVGEINENDIASLLSRTQILEQSLITLHNSFQQSQNIQDTVRASESKDIVLLREQIDLQEIRMKQIISDIDFHNKDNSITLDQANYIQKIESIEQEIMLLKAARETLITTEKKGINLSENGVLLAEKELQKEYVESGDYKIISPYSGIVSKRSIDIGSMVSLGTEAFRLVGVENSLSRITKQEIKFFVPEALQDQIYIGQEVYFNTGGGSKPIRATIYRIAPEIDFETRSITVQAKVDEDVVFSHASTVRVSLKSDVSSYVIPSSSIYIKDKRRIIYYKKDNGKLGVKDVVIISDDGEQALVSGDFDDTLKVVTTPIFIK